MSSLRRAALSCAASLVLFTGAANAQIPPHLVRRRVASVEVAGETSGATGARDVGIPIGAPLTRRLLRATTQRLIASGRWADVQIDVATEGNDVALVVHLVPRIVITRVDVIGNAIMSADDVRHALGLSAGGELEGRELTELARPLVEEYADRGYVDARVTLQLRDTDDPTRKVLRAEVAENDPLRIAAYAYEGEAPPSRVDLPTAIGLGVGDVLDRRRLREGLVQAAQRVRSDGWLEARLGQPTVHREGGLARIEIPARFGPHYEVRLVGHEPLTRETIESVLHLDRDRLTRPNLDALRTRVLELLQRHGFHHADVDVVRYAGEVEGTAVLEVQMEPGRQLHVVGMSFPGASHFTSDYLREQVISVLEEQLPDTRMFAPVDSDTLDRIGLGGRSVMPRDRQTRAPLDVNPARVYYQPLYEQAVEHLGEVYQAAGFLSAHAGPPRLEFVGRGRAIVVVPIFEGARTLLFGVTLRGNELLGERELLETARLRRGEPFSHLALDEAVTRMIELYQERGYLYARIDKEVRFSEDGERAEIVLRVIERFEVRFGEIRVEGARRTSEDLIRDVLRFAPGDVFRPSVVRASEEALMTLGIFTSVNITPGDADLAERVKPVVVTVRERMPFAFDGSLGVSTGQGARANLEFQLRNVAGFALDIALRLSAGFQFIFQDDELARNITPLPLGQRLERRFSLTFTLPHIPGLPNVRSSLDIVHVRDNERAFGLDKFIGVALSVSWRPLRLLTFTFSSELEHNGVQLFGDRTSIEEVLNPPQMGEDPPPPPDPRIVRLLRVPEGDSLVVSAGLSGAVDLRDSPFVPTEGFFGSASVEWVRTLETDTQDDRDPFFSHFLKLNATANGYVPLADNWVLAGQLRVGGIVHLQSTSRTYPNRQYFLGGIDSLRGFNQDQLQPQDLADLQLEDPDLRTGTVLQGGDFFYLARLELRFPLFESLHGAIFTDVGNHWADPSSIELNADFVRPTAGVGVRVVTPVGPLALDVGFNLLRRELLDEPIAAVHFSIGVF